MKFDYPWMYEKVGEGVVEKLKLDISKKWDLPSLEPNFFYIKTVCWTYFINKPTGRIRRKIRRWQNHRKTENTRKKTFSPEKIGLTESRADIFGLRTSCLTLSWPPEPCRNWQEIEFWSYLFQPTKVCVILARMADYWNISGGIIKFLINVFSCKKNDISISDFKINLHTNDNFNTASLVHQYSKSIIWAVNVAHNREINGRITKFSIVGLRSKKLKA